MRFLFFPSMALALALTLPSTASAVEPDSGLTAKAGAAFAAKDWPLALSSYRTLAALEPRSGLVQFRYGVARLYSGDVSGGLSSLNLAEELGWPVPQVAYRMATAHAAAGRLDDAIAELRRAAKAGFARISLADEDPLLASLRADLRWPDLRAEIDRTVHPCQYDPRFRSFDFWLGTWDVSDRSAPPDAPPALNVVTLEFGDCVIHEHWKSLNSSGESFNVFDASRGEWFQTWVDDGGGLHQYHGNPDESGNMRFTSDLQYAPGQSRRATRLTFFKEGPDRVRQLSEQSPDGGKTWTVNYDLIYKRRPGSSPR